MRDRLNNSPIIGTNTIIESNVSFGSGVKIGHNCVVEKNVFIDDNVFIDSNTIIRSGVHLQKDSFIGANCIIGEYQMDFCIDRNFHEHFLTIGNNSIIRSGSIIYSGSKIGDCFQSGHHVTIRENTQIGNNVSVGTLTDIQGNCKIGNYVRLHSNVHVGMASNIDDCCWIYPYVVLTNDPTPPSETEIGVHIHSFAIVATSSVILPGVDIQSDSLIGAGSIVNKNVKKYQVIAGNPGKIIGDVRDIRNKETGEPHYPWRYHFDRAMPWENFGFNNWYNSLDSNMKKMLIGD